MKLMQKRSLLIAVLGFVSLNAIAPASYADIADYVSNASVSSRSWVVGSG